LFENSPQKEVLEGAVFKSEAAISSDFFLLLEKLLWEGMPRDLTVQVVHKMVSIIPKAEVDLRIDDVVGKTVGRPSVLWVY
jgi:hypothetical protein